MKNIHLLPNILTALGLICGLFVIFKLNMTGVGAVDEAVLKSAAAFLLLASLFDLLDGALARALRVESEFGGFFDSIADAITFGVAPSVILLKSLSAMPGTFYSFLITTGALVYSTCGVLRLVRFNVSGNQKIKLHDDLDITSKAYFIGLPIPAAAAATVSLDFVLMSQELHEIFDPTDPQRTFILFFALVFIGYLMVSRWRFPSLKGLQTKVTSFPLVFCLILTASAVFYGLLYNFAWVFFSLSWGYLCFSWSYFAVKYLMSRLKKFTKHENNGN
ncbi:MAG: phosphatidylcholine/phosphatidylserine synthase [Chlamydiales bacterium]